MPTTAGADSTPPGFGRRRPIEVLAVAAHVLARRHDQRLEAVVHRRAIGLPSGRSSVCSVVGVGLPRAGSGATVPSSFTAPGAAAAGAPGAAGPEPAGCAQVRLNAARIGNATRTASRKEPGAGMRADCCTRNVPCDVARATAALTP